MPTPTMPPEAAQMLAEATIIRVATARPDGTPHVAPFWFSFDGDRIVLDTLANTTVANLRHEPRVGTVVDLGDRFEELRGTTVTGTARLYTPDNAPEVVLDGVERIRSAHAAEIATPAFAEYSARETRPQVYVEITPIRASWWILASR
jgi:nitroimidazol reductase NimA-like FMN-containing flavoprotein (pyridoxamine 5'-phosphate oxidase superfamily)